jgi:ubiquinone biosynthesis protein UbiJ
MFSKPAAAAINHAMRDADWARARLRPFAGRSVRFEVPPLSAALMVEADGGLAPAPPGIEPAAIVRVSGPALLRIACLHDASARQEVQLVGDGALASAVTAVLSGLRWDLEEDLSFLVGDIAAHRLMRAGGALLAWHAQTASRLAQALAEYWTEEQRVIASRAALSGFASEVDALRDDIERLDQRIERLTRAGG